MLPPVLTDAAAVVAVLLPELVVCAGFRTAATSSEHESGAGYERTDLYSPSQSSHAMDLLCPSPVAGWPSHPERLRERYRFFTTFAGKGLRIGRFQTFFLVRALRLENPRFQDRYTSRHASAKPERRSAPETHKRATRGPPTSCRGQVKAHEREVVSHGFGWPELLLGRVVGAIGWSQACPVGVLQEPLRGNEGRLALAAIGKSSGCILSKYNRPKYNRPKYNGPKYNGPKYNGPKYNGPKYNGPKYNGPKHNKPGIDKPGQNSRRPTDQRSDPGPERALRTEAGRFGAQQKAGFSSQKTRFWRQKAECCEKGRSTARTWSGATARSAHTFGLGQRCQARSTGTR